MPLELCKISDDKCTPTSTPERPQCVGAEEESSEIKIHSELCVEIPGNNSAAPIIYCDYFTYLI